MRHFLKEKNSIISSFFQKKVLRFLSRRYSANFRRSRLVFFLQTTILTLIGPLFRNNPETTKPPKAKSRQGKFCPKGPPFHLLLFQGNLQNRTCLKGPPLGFFSALCYFSSKIIQCRQRVPPLSFLIFCN